MQDDAATITRWPENAGVHPSGVAVVTVNHNTAPLIGLLLWSLHRVLKTAALGQIVVVDNGSSDSSLELLNGIADAGVCHVIANAENRGHGPALNQGVSYLAERARITGRAPAWVWILDSDCVIASPDALTSALRRSVETGASVTGEHQPDPWHGVDRFGTHCLLIDPARAWQDPIATFEAGGDPSFALLSSCQAAGLGLTEFGFQREGHVIHRGRGTLAQLVESGERSNPLYGWAVDHHEAHFGGIAGAKARYLELTARFESEVPTLDARTLAHACSLD